jgi:hypothetical protein
MNCMTNQTPKKRGRKPLYATEEERAEARRKRMAAYCTSDEYKEARKKKYQKNKSYRLVCIDRAKAYAQRMKQSDIDAYARLIRKNVSAPDRFSEWRTVLHRFHKRSAPRQLQTFTIEQFSKLIGRDVNLVRTWVRTERLPAPPWVDCLDRSYKVYSSAQAIEMALLICIHLKTDSAHFLDTNRNLIKQLTKTTVLK